MKQRELFLGLLAITITVITSGFTNAGPYHDAVLADDPVAYWRLGESDPDIAANAGLLGQANIGEGYYTEGVQVGQSSLVLGETDTSSFLSQGERINRWVREVRRRPGLWRHGILS